MGWLVGGVWIGVVVLSALILAFCAYELVWKARRLQGDLKRLTGLNESMAALQAEVAVVQRRLEASAARDVEKAG